MALSIELVAHMDAGDRRLWTEDQNRRPLSSLGRRQADVMAGALGAQPLDALYSSPALRCIQTLEPLARRFGLEAVLLTGLHENEGWLPPPAWRVDFPTGDYLGGAYAAGLAWDAIMQIRQRHAGGRVAACTHGDIGPALVVFLMGAYGLDKPAPHVSRGGWYTLHFDGDALDIEQHPIIEGFPLA